MGEEGGGVELCESEGPSEGVLVAAAEGTDEVGCTVAVLMGEAVLGESVTGEVVVGATVLVVGAAVLVVGATVVVVGAAVLVVGAAVLVVGAVVGEAVAAGGSGRSHAIPALVVEAQDTPVHMFQYLEFRSASGGLELDMTLCVMSATCEAEAVATTTGPHIQ